MTIIIIYFILQSPFAGIVLFTRMMSKEYELCLTKPTMDFYYCEARSSCIGHQSYDES